MRFADLYVPPVYIERKSMGDLWGTLTSDYERFRREIIKSSDLNAVLPIVIEGSISDIRKGFKHSKRDGESIIDQLMTIWVKYGVPHYFFNDRHEMSYWIYKLFYSIGKLYIEDKLGFKNASIKKIRELL